MENVKVYTLLISSDDINDIQKDSWRTVYTSVDKDKINEVINEFKMAYSELKTPVWLTLATVNNNSYNIIKRMFITNASFEAVRQNVSKKQMGLDAYADVIYLFNAYCKNRIDYQTYSSFLKINKCIYEIENVLDIYEHMTDQGWYGDDAIKDDNYKLLDDFCLYLINNYSEFMTKDLTKVRKRNLPLSDWAVVESAGLLKTKLSNWIYY